MRAWKLLVAFGLLFSFANPASARPVERVPQDGTLQQAIQRVSNQGTILIADGVYPAPPDGFRIRNPNKTFTIRAAAGPGASVVIDGQATEPLFEIETQNARDGHSIAFEHITFRNGFSDELTRAGGVTIRNAKVVFVSCDFEANVFGLVTGTGGGAIQAFAGSYVRFTNANFRDNTSLQFGGAIFAFQSEIEVAWSTFDQNRVNLAEHGPLSAGGAIYVLDSVLDVVRTRFESNEAGWVGGAIYAFGIWREPLDDPATLATVRNSIFVKNRARAPNPVPGPPGGGAIHVEDHATVVIDGSRFIENEGTFGGALANYRGVFEISDSIFLGNFGEPDPGTGAQSLGGVVNLTSADFANASTDFGAINRRPGEFHARNTLFQGRFGDVQVPTQQGGCLFAAGDSNRQDGVGGVAQDGTVEDNRAKLTFDQVIFHDCDVETEGAVVGLGGAMLVTLVDLDLVSSLVMDSDALGDGALGGGLLSFDRSFLRVTDTTFIDNTAENRAGAINASGGRIEVRDSRFLENAASPGVNAPIQNTQASALELSPGADEDIVGVVEDSLFSLNEDIPIVDLDSAGAGPYNRVVYNGNEFHSTTFGTRIYKELALGNGGLTVNQLNALVINRADGTTDDKSTVNNIFRGAAPRAGQVVAAPSAVSTVGAPGEAPPIDAALGFAWSGPNAQLAGQNLPATSGVLDVAAAGNYPLRVGGTGFGAAAVAERPCSRGRFLCLNDERFLVEVDWREFQGDVGNGLAVFSEADSGLMFFFDPDNWEMLIKVLDACGFNDRFWVFSAATTNVEYTLRVTDTVTGATKSYFNPLGNAADAITDTDALAACTVPDPEAGKAPIVSALQDPEYRALARAGAPAAGLEKQGDCEVGPFNLCLNQGRFRLELQWRDFEGNVGPGARVPFGSDDSGLFFFFDPDNWEMLVKVLNGCGFNDRYWVFSAATTNVEYTLTVTDTETGAVSTYFNRLGRAAPAVTDTGAFATCP